MRVEIFRKDRFNDIDVRECGSDVLYCDKIDVKTFRRWRAAIDEYERAQEEMHLKLESTS